MSPWIAFGIGVLCGIVGVSAVTVLYLQFGGWRFRA